MNDLEVATQRLKEKELSLVIVKDSKTVFETNVEGLKGFIQAINKLGDSLAEASVADKIVGKAATLLCVYSKVKAVFAVTMSQSGLETLKAHRVPCKFESLVPTILNKKKTDRCPFEKVVEDTSPKEAYQKIKQLCT